MRILLLPVAVATLVTLSACSFGAGAASPGTTAGAGGPTPASASPVPDSASPAAHSTGPIPICADFPVSTIVAGTGRGVYTTATERDGDSEGAKLYGCEYTDSADPDDALDGFNLVVYRGGDTDAILKELASILTSGATPVSGIGDRAQEGDGELDVVVGTDVVVVSDAVHEGDLADLSPSVYRSFATKLIAKL